MCQPTLALTWYIAIHWLLVPAAIHRSPCPHAVSGINNYYLLVAPVQSKRLTMPMFLEPRALCPSFFTAWLSLRHARDSFRIPPPTTHPARYDLVPLRVLLMGFCSSFCVLNFFSQSYLVALLAKPSGRLIARGISPAHRPL